MSNPLIDKYFELYPEKKEEPKPDYYKGEKSYAEELEELEKPKPEYVKLSQEQTDTLNKYLQNSYVPPQSVTTSNPHPPTFKTLTSYDTHSTEDSFLQIAEKIKNGEAKVSSMSMERDIMSGTSITFEVQVYT